MKSSKAEFPEIQISQSIEVWSLMIYHLRQATKYQPCFLGPLPGKIRDDATFVSNRWKATKEFIPSRFDRIFVVIHA
jgi:hypothetical protein